jgi:hypothetical protein
VQAVDHRRRHHQVLHQRIEQIDDGTVRRNLPPGNVNATVFLLLLVIGSTARNHVVIT